MEAPSGNPIDSLTRLYERTLLVSLSLTPLAAVLYLQFFQDPALLFNNHPFHELAISVAIAISAFISLVTWLCHRASGEPVLRWMTLAFLGFTLVYALHGLFTRLSHDHLVLFLVFGPVSRLVMAALLLKGLLVYGESADPPGKRGGPVFWGGWTLGFLLLDYLLGRLALSPLAGRTLLQGIEVAALALSLASIAYILRRRLFSPMLQVYCLSLAFFAQASLGFLLARPWNHQWWLAHAVFGTGFLLLSHGVVRAYHTTRTFSGIYSQEEIMRRLVQANEQLERLASTDPLTGISNRRELFARLETERARSLRTGAPLSLLSLDLDHFKHINDVHGHQAGDAVLVAVADCVRLLLRSHDILGRLGGEEFLAVLPGTAGEDAATVAERIREDVEALAIPRGPETLRVTVSIGVARFGPDGASAEAVCRVADERLYRAKRQGRNQVAAGPAPAGPETP